MKNQYEGKTAKEVWGEWNEEQRAHFLIDHWGQLRIMVDKNKPKESIADIMAKYPFSELKDGVVRILKEHITFGQYKKGGSIPNNYSGKNAEQVWNEWTSDQRIHFLQDHHEDINKIFSKEGNENTELNSINWYTHLYAELPTAIKQALMSHIDEGQYKKGGIPAKKITYKDLVPGSIYKYLHEKGTNVIYSNKGMSGDYIFTDSKDGSWIAISKEEIPTSIAPIKNTVLVKSKNAESFFPDFTQKVSFIELFTK